MHLRGIHNSEFQVKCPDCYQTDGVKPVAIVSEFTSTQTDQIRTSPHYSCNKCNNFFSYVPSSIINHGMVNKYEPVLDINRATINPNSELKIDISILETGLNSINSNLNNNIGYKLDQLVGVFNMVYSELIKVTEKNNQLMEKLAEDPLILTRKNINQFELK